VDVLCARDPSQAQTETEQSIQIHTVAVSRRYKGRMSYLAEYMLALLLFTVALLRLQIRNRYDLIHIHNMPDFLVFTGLLPKLLGAKIILDIHDPMPEFYRSKFDAGAGSSIVSLLKLQERVSASIAHAVIAANANFRRNLIRRGVPASKITVINNVADAKIFNRALYNQLQHPRCGRFTLIYPGTIAPRYNLDTAIRALPLLLPAIPHVRLLVIGPQVDHVDELTALAAELGVLQAVEFRPSLPVHEVAQAMACADVGIYTAQPGPHMSIATPTKVLEYAAMGLPIVASRLAVLEEFFPESAIRFFEPGNVTHFAQAVLELYAEPGRRHELVEHADHHFVRKFSWESEQAKYLKLLQQLLPTKMAQPVVKHHLLSGAQD
jgi:glycosyltransferase involved in cell wall biosynthesis